MSTFRCPHCSEILSAAELKEGWCEKCGKHAPEHLLSAAAKEDRQHRHEHLTHKQAPLPHAPEPRTTPDVDKDLEPARPLPTGLIARAAGIVLALIAMGTMLFPWGSKTFVSRGDPSGSNDPITIEQTGVQMLYGDKTIRQGSSTKSSQLTHVEQEVSSHQRFVPHLIVGFPICLLLAIGSLALLDHTSCWRWAATWASLAVMLVLMQLAVGLPTDGNPFERIVGPAMWVGIASAFVVVMLSIWPMASAPEASANAWAVAAPTLLLAAAIYAGAFFLPAIYFQDAKPVTTSSVSLREPEAGDREKPISGSSSFDHAYIFNLQCWHANPAAWLACLLLLCRRWLWAAAAGSLAIGLALTHFLYNHLDAGGLTYTWGYWMWIGSFALLTMGSLIGWVVTKFLRTKPSPLGTSDAGE